MKRLIVVTVSILTVVALVCGVIPALAAKPSNVIKLSNGFPSGMHFNLNIHGKDFCPTEVDDNNSIWVPLYTEEPLPIIQYVSNRKSKGNDNPYELNVIDACTMDGDNTAKVWLPYQIRPEEGADPIDANGYFVYARILGKPNNSKKTLGDPSEVILYPNFIVEAENNGGNTNNVVPLGLITTKDVYSFDHDEQVFKRFDPPDSGTPGKKTGKSMAQSITDLFMWSGWICYGGNPDTNGDGEVDAEDIPANEQYIPDLNDDGVIDLWEWQFCHADYDGDGDVDEDDIPANAADYVPNLSYTGADDNITVYEWQFYHPDFNNDGNVDETGDVTAIYDDAPADFDPEPVVGTAFGDDSPSDIDVEDWLEYQEGLGNCYHYDNPIWISNIADLVISGQPIYNDGGKLLQIRFYPVATTEITEQAHIIVKKVTEPSSDNTTQFEFNTSYSDPFTLFNGQFFTTTVEEPGPYSVEEVNIPDGWDLISAVCSDGSDPTEIYLDPGETVTVTFTNQKT